VYDFITVKGHAQAIGAVDTRTNTTKLTKNISGFGLVLRSIAGGE